jgi:hypothetical protein
MPVTLTSTETIEGGLAGREIHHAPISVTAKAVAAELHFHQTRPDVVIGY